MMKAFALLLLSALAVSCSDPPGWTLWSHTYSSADEIEERVDKWSSHDSYSNLADCKKGTETELKRIEASA
jgi:hypothetical protein